MSMFAATICSSVGSPAARREKRLEPRQHGLDARVAGRRRRLDARPSRRPRENRRGADAWCRSRPATRASHSSPGQDPVDVGVLEADPRRHQPRRAVRLERLLEARRPAERVEASIAWRSAAPRRGRSWQQLDAATDRPLTRCVRARPSSREQRSTSATLQAWAMHPRGVYGASASKTSLIDPTHASAGAARTRRAGGARARPSSG